MLHACYFVERHWLGEGNAGWHTHCLVVVIALAVVAAPITPERKVMHRRQVSSGRLDRGCQRISKFLINHKKVSIDNLNDQDWL